MAALEVYCRHVARHANLIEIFHVGICGSLLYYVMELADDDGSQRPVRGSYAMGRVLYEMLCGRAGSEPPALPEAILDRPSSWDMPRVGRCIARACGASADQRYATADRMIEDIEACRDLSLESLLSDVADDRPMPRASWHRYAAQLGVAAINALPWVLAIVLVMMLVQRFL